MAITVRIPDDLDAALEHVAHREHVSKHALLLQGARMVVDRASRRDDIEAGLAHVMSHDAALLERLADA